MNREHSPCWDYGGNRPEEPIHRIHSYPAKFPAFITTEALKYAESQDIRVKTVADVFCGCGTTAVEAMNEGKDFWGFDINPVATLIAQVKTKRYKAVKLDAYHKSIITQFTSSSVGNEEYERVNERIKYWFVKDNILDLLRLKKAIINSVPASSHYRKFFLCAFSNILKPTSRWLMKSIKPQVDPEKPVINVLDAYQKQFTKMRNAVLAKDKTVNSPSAKIDTGNFLLPKKKLRHADLIVSSPPYAASYDYADIHQLSALWLDYTSDYRSLRKGMVGTRYGVAQPSEDDIDGLLPIGAQTYQELMPLDKGKARAMYKYFSDLEQMAYRCYEIVNRGGMALFVIGNTRYRRVEIDSAEYLARSMEKVGFKAVQKHPRKISAKNMTPYRDAWGRFTRNPSSQRVYDQEFVVTGRRK